MGHKCSKHDDYSVIDHDTKLRPDTIEHILLWELALYFEGILSMKQNGHKVNP